MSGDSSAPLRQRWPRPTRPQPIVFIGAGGIVRNAELPAYRRAGFPIAGVFDVNPATSAAVARDFDVPRVYTTLIEATSERNVVFDLAVPAGAVLEVIERLPTRAAVLIQKPLGRDLAEAARIVAACRERELIAAVNFQLRFSPNMLALQDAIERGALGAIRDVEFRVNVFTPWRLWDFLKGIPRHEILYHSIHYLDLARALLGEPKGAYCRVVKNPELTEYSDTGSVSVLDYGDQCRCVISCNHAHDFGPRHMMSELKVEGTRGAMVAKLGVNLDYPQGEPDQLELAVLPDRAWRQIPLEGSWFDEAFEGPMSNLQRHVAGVDPVLHTRVDDAARTMALVEACYRSSSAGGTPIPDII
jgi:predicted dehydrogenase